MRGSNLPEISALLVGFWQFSGGNTKIRDYFFSETQHREKKLISLLSFVLQQMVDAKIYLLLPHHTDKFHAVLEVCCELQQKFATDCNLTHIFVSFNDWLESQEG